MPAADYIDRAGRTQTAERSAEARWHADVGGPVPLLRLDAELAAGIPSPRRAEAERLCTAEVQAVEPGPLVGFDRVAVAKAGYGLLVLTGMLCRRLEQAARTVAELVGPGDIFRPWEQAAEWSSVPLASSWTVIDPARVAILDRRFARRVAPFPELAIAINRRSLRRVAEVATLMGMASHRRVETRLLLLFWHLADRFGSVRADGVVVPVHLTHLLLAEMVSVRRPTVTTALTRLEAEGVLIRQPDGWLLEPASATRCFESPPLTDGPPSPSVPTPS